MIDFSHAAGGIAPMKEYARISSEPLMNETAWDQDRQENGDAGLGPVAEELKRESARLQQLAEELEARAEAQAEMRANYPHLKQAVYATLREQFERDLPPLPDKDLETLAAEEGALPLEAFIAELEPPTERRE
jgi:hypothetical protein